MLSTASSRRAVLAGAAALTGLSACGLKTVKTSSFTPKGLQDLEAALVDHVAKGSAPGLVGLVQRGSETRAWALGVKSLGEADPVLRSTQFRIASMTKAVTAIAANMLIEDGRLRLDETVERLLPELADRRVLRTPASALEDTVAARRPITVEDVLTFRLGWGIDFADTPFTRAVADLPGFGMPNPEAPYTPDTFMRRLGELPLQAQPGEQWLYTAGSNLLGVLVARAAGQPLETVFRERIFGPLGMKDTGFAGDPERLPTAYMPNQGKLDPFDAPGGAYAKAPSFPAGDSGLVSTADDFAALGRFMMSGTEPGGRRLLSAAALTRMTTDALTPAQRKGGELILGPHRGWGHIGVYVQQSPEGIPAGAYGWDGGFGTSWFNDPSRDLTAVLLTQRIFDGPDAPQLHKDFWRGAIAAVA
jgi:CubicO group peptidase (beta-lactamase class C family)